MFDIIVFWKRIVFLLLTGDLLWSITDAYAYELYLHKSDGSTLIHKVPITKGHVIGTSSTSYPGITSLSRNISFQNAMTSIIKDFVEPIINETNLEIYKLFNETEVKSLLENVNMLKQEHFNDILKEFDILDLDNEKTIITTPRKTVNTHQITNPEHSKTPSHKPTNINKTKHLSTRSLKYRPKITINEKKNWHKHNINDNNRYPVDFKKLYIKMENLMRQLNDYERNLQSSFDKRIAPLPVDKTYGVTESLREIMKPTTGITTMLSRQQFVQSVLDLQKEWRWSDFRIFAFKLAELMSEKPDWILTRLWGAMEIHVGQEIRSGRLQDLGDHIEKSLQSFVQEMNFAPPITQSVLASIFLERMMNYSLFSPDIRSIIETVEGTYMSEEGVSLKESLYLVYSYPYVADIGRKDVVEGVCSAIMKPYYRFAGNPVRAELIKAIETAMLNRLTRESKRAEDDDDNADDEKYKKYIVTQHANKEFMDIELSNNNEDNLLHKQSKTTQIDEKVADGDDNHRNFTDEALSFTYEANIFKTNLTKSTQAPEYHKDLIDDDTMYTDEKDEPINLPKTTQNHKIHIEFIDPNFTEEEHKLKPNITKTTQISKHHKDFTDEELSDTDIKDNNINPYLTKTTRHNGENKEVIDTESSDFDVLKWNLTKKTQNYENLKDLLTEEDSNYTDEDDNLKSNLNIALAHGTVAMPKIIHNKESMPKVISNNENIRKVIRNKGNNSNRYRLALT